jgi:hypothetical protein
MLTLSQLGGADLAPPHWLCLPGKKSLIMPLWSCLDICKLKDSLDHLQLISDVHLKE